MTPIKKWSKDNEQLKNVIYVVFMRSIERIKAIKLDGQKWDTVNWYTTKCFPEILQEVNIMVLMLQHDKPW